MNFDAQSTLGIMDFRYSQRLNQQVIAKTQDQDILRIGTAATAMQDAFSAFPVPDVVLARYIDALKAVNAPAAAVLQAQLQGIPVGTICRFAFDQNMTVPAVPMHVLEASVPTGHKIYAVSSAKLIDALIAHGAFNGTIDFRLDNRDSSAEYMIARVANFFWNRFTSSFGFHASGLAESSANEIPDAPDVISYFMHAASELSSRSCGYAMGREGNTLVP